MEWCTCEESGTRSLRSPLHRLPVGQVSSPLAFIVSNHMAGCKPDIYTPELELGLVITNVIRNLYRALWSGSLEYRTVATAVQSAEVRVADGGSKCIASSAYLTTATWSVDVHKKEPQA